MFLVREPTEPLQFNDTFKNSWMRVKNTSKSGVWLLPVRSLTVDRRLITRRLVLYDN